MKNKILTIIASLILLLQAGTPAGAAQWDYILDDYPNQNDQEVIKNYLNEFDKNLKADWYTPLYRRDNAKFVFFYLHKDGTITVERFVANTAYKNETPQYKKNFEKHTKTFFSEYEFKPFPAELKADKIKMAYALKSNYTPYYIAGGYGALAINKCNRDFFVKQNF